MASVTWRSLLPGSGQVAQSPDETRSSKLLRFIEARYGELGGEDFEALLDSLGEFLRELMDGGDLGDVLRALRAVEDVVHVKKLVGDDFIRKLVEIMRGVFEAPQPRASEVVKRIAAAFGRVVASADIVEDQVRWAVHWLENAKSSTAQQRLSAVLVLKSLAENAPASFNVHISTFLRHIWEGLHGEELLLRQTSAEALRACLLMFVTRETRNRVQWYHRLAKDAVTGLGATRPSIKRLHGCLLALRELLDTSGEFMLARYAQVANRSLRLLEGKGEVNNVVRLAVISLVPRLVDFCPERFMEEHWTVSMHHMMDVVSPKNPWELSVEERAQGFVALKETILAASKHRQMGRLAAWMEQVVDRLSAAILARGRGEEAPYQEALECCGVLAQALGGDWEQQAKALLLPMAATGVSDALTSAMSKIAESIPSLKEDVSDLLLNAVAFALVNAPFRDDLPAPVKRELKRPSGENTMEAKLTALKILRTFDFGSCSLIDFIMKHVMPLTRKHSDPSIREAAAMASTLIVGRYVEQRGEMLSADDSVHGIVQKLVQAGITDRSEQVRMTTMRLLRDTPVLDKILEKDKCMRQLFLGLGDGSCCVGRVAIQLVGRLGAKGKSMEVVRPMLETVLNQLLLQFEISPENEYKEESARKLGLLVKSAPYVILPNTDKICGKLIKVLEAEMVQWVEPAKPGLVGEDARVVNRVAKSAVFHGADAVVTAALETVGYLAETATGQLIGKGYMDKFLKLTVEVLRRKADEEKMLEAAEAVKTLGKIVSSTGNVTTPYYDFPWLLPELLKMLQVEDPSVRKTVVKVLGIISALDPAKFRGIQAMASGEGRLELEGVRPVKRGELSDSSSLERSRLYAWGGRSLDSGMAELMPVSGIGSNSEESYSIIAVNALLRILKTPAHSAYHQRAVGTLGTITKSLSIASVPFLQTLIPNWCDAIYNGDTELRVHILEQFIHIVGVVKQHMRRFLDRIMLMLEHLWIPTCNKKTLLKVLRLIGELAGVCRSCFARYLHWLVPRFIMVLETSEDDVLVVALSSLSCVGFALQSRFHRILPSLSAILSRSRVAVRAGIQRPVLHCLRGLLQELQVSELAGAIIRPLVSLLNEKVLRNEIMETFSTVAIAVGPDSKILSYVKRAMAAHNIQHSKFDHLSSHLCQVENPQPTCSNWEAGAVWRDEFEPALPPLTEETGAVSCQRLRLDEDEMRHAWDTAHRYTYDDWADWMRRVSLRLVRASPSPAIRACYTFAQKIPGLAKDLFPASFISCWSELGAPGQRRLIRSLEAALASPTIPHEIITTLLNLAEFMEHHHSQLPLDTRTLAALAAKCHAFAKALHYKELEFLEDPHSAVEAILAINNQLRQPEAADGMLKYARKELDMEVKDSWYEKLHKWDKALHHYKNSAAKAESGSLASIDANLGCMRCYFALWDWGNLSKLCRREWDLSDPLVRTEIAPLGAEASWHMGEWEEMTKYLTKPNSSKDTPDATTTAFLNAVHAVHNGNFQYAMDMIDEARGHLSADLAALAGESYDRAYESMVRAQQLTELDEVVQFILLEQSGQYDQCKRIQEVWTKRLQTVQRRVEVWQGLLSVRYMALPHNLDKGNWIKFASMCRQQKREHEARATLHILLGYDPFTKFQGEPGYGAGSGDPEIMYAFLKHMYVMSNDEDRREIYDRLGDLIENDLDKPGVSAKMLSPIIIGSGPLTSKAYVRLGKWMQQQHRQYEELTADKEDSLLKIMDKGTKHAGNWAKAWREWALFHLLMMNKYEKSDPERAMKHVAPAARGFFHALKLSQDHALNGGMSGSGPSKDTYQDILRLLTLWFNHGDAPNVCKELEEGFDTVHVETWLVVIPQIIARIHIRAGHVQRLITMLLDRIGRAHPQALLYPLLVACYSNSGSRREAAQKVLSSMRGFAPELVGEAELVSQQLVEIAVLLDEKWHEALEEASRLYFAEADPQAMLDLMIPLHEALRCQDARTTSESRFIQQHGAQLREAYAMLRNYKTTRQETSTQCAWDNYYHVFKRINRDLHNMTVLHLSDVAPELLDRSMNVAVPGTYAPFQEEQVCMQRIVPEIQVIKSKQRPRKLTIEGSDGNDYVFLLKGHEDLRQDERVMQLFGLVNTLLVSDYQAAENELSIARYAVTPLSPDVGLIGWVPNCDTMHQLIRDYRDSKSIPINLEHQLMKTFAPNYDNLTLIQKIEVFEHALDSTAGDDLRKVMWIKSRTSELWLAHRTCYIRSCAVMSIVGYLLGLGDRHPSNLMIDRYTGKLLHIDFGDCFEAGMNRDKFPEKVPFRLTRMMVKAMEVSGVEGTFRKTCELVMRVLRMEKDRLMAVLEAFIYDPLINWRLALNRVEAVGAGGMGLGASNEESQDLDFGMAARNDLRDRDNQPGDAHEILNQRAVEVTQRVRSKLSGREFASDRSVSVEEQVDRVITEATLHSNLCQAYIGWCPFW
ncbi:hypothetical protein BSKO_01335 [Bryopsis sp. KO-2023]|nr:hypothetical protein BSKO_01335 [Bryopsis sp. KO-2023]